MSTPMFQQYHALKAKQPDAILFFRMGDFYEMFFDDAVVASKVLDLTLTARNKQEANPIPMCGIPHHAAPAYIQRLTDAGFRVAIGEQVEDPAQAKGLVKRDIVRVVTPGVVFDPTALAGADPNYLLALSTHRGRVGLAVLDLSTGDLRGTDLPSMDAVAAEIHRFEPKEVLLAKQVELSFEAAEALTSHGTITSQVDTESWRPALARDETCACLGVGDLAGFGVPDDALFIRSVGALLRYARDTTGSRPANVHTLRPYAVHGYMVLDETTRRNLELFRTLRDGRRQGSLLALLDQCSTGMGSRRLREWLAFPLLDSATIASRQRSITDLLGDVPLRHRLRAGLGQVADVERIGARVAQGTATPRDLGGLRRSLLAVPEALDGLGALPALRAHVPTDLCDDVRVDLATWLVEDPPQHSTEAGLVPPEAHPELTELHRIQTEGAGILSDLEARERQATGIPSLKVKRNKVFGYFLEVTRAHIHRVPDHYLRKQTLSNCERYITPELKELEEQILTADERRKALEYTLFVALRDRVSAQTARLLTLARHLATLDALAALAQCADMHRWSLPTVDDSTTLNITQGRHPVVEAELIDERFVPNDVVLDPESRALIVLTGPNMAGKSTVLRQTALIVLMAQIGSYVPAESAHIGLCDRVFTRVGATDDLARGRSTFMVEMSETAAILHAATRRSLVVLDEIGRGTSTYDGLSIAWAVAEDVAIRIGCRGLFATHYHELCELADRHDNVANQSVAVSEYGGEIVFLRTLKEGGASRSYGIQCARLAGLPGRVIDRAKGLLDQFEKVAPRNDREQLSLFSVGIDVDATPQAEPADSLREQLSGVDPDSLSPRQAHDLLYALKKLL